MGTDAQDVQLAVDQLASTEPASSNSAELRVSKPRSVPQRIIDAVETAMIVTFRRLRQIGSRMLLKKKLQTNSAVLQPVNAELERAHRDYWASLGSTSGQWLRYYVNVSGIESEKYVPGDLYYSMIDHRLNDADQNDLYNNKNNLDRCFGAELLPKTIARRVCGVFSDAEHRVCENPFDTLPAQDLILKPSFDTSAGQNIELFRYVSGSYFLADGTLLTAGMLETGFGDHFIIQELLQQHDFCWRFNPGSLNTFRVYTYRSVSDERIHVLKTVFKMGCGNTVVDNQVLGGVVCVVQPDGKLGEFAATTTGEKCTAHPESGEAFKGRVVPHFDRLTDLAEHIAERIPSHRTLALDVALNEEGKAILIEVNPMAAAIDLMQCDGGPLFGEFTDEVRDYCVAHPENERKKIIRP